MNVPERENAKALIRVVPRITPSSLDRDKGVFLLGSLEI
jgi:hypothetical protein